jgi:hypothetical protein
MGARGEWKKAGDFEGAAEGFSVLQIALVIISYYSGEAIPYRRGP